jgi:peptidoglycan/xylan/chitin deacetylase (PgdA/CDA1 family)
VNKLSTEIIGPMPSPAADNKKDASKLGTDTTSTIQPLNADNQELAGTLETVSIPITEPPAADDIDNQEPLVLLETVSIPIPITELPAPDDVDNQELVEELGIAIMASVTPTVVDTKGQAIERDVVSTPAITPRVVDNKQQAIGRDIGKISTITLPAIARRFKLKRDKPNGPQMLLIGAMITVLFCVIGSTYVLASRNALSRSQNGSSRAISQRRKLKLKQITPTDTPAEDAQEVTALGQQYMNALLNQQYSIMWSLLHPQVQAAWPDETSFSNYWQRRFQGFTLQNFTLGQAHSLSFWVNPETMTRYNQVEVLPISLQLSAQVPADQISRLPTPDQHASQLFQNLPLIAQRATPQTGRAIPEQWLILSGGPADLEAPILPPITPVSKTITMPILMYHHITNIPTHDLLDLSLTVKPTVFSQQLDYLKQHGYHTITYNQLFDFLYYNGPLPSKPIILTFDDGYDDAYKFAYPILQAHGYSGTFFIITGKVDWKGQVTWNELREMLANGMQMGSHTITHRDMGAVWLFSHAEAQQELQQSQQSLETQLGIVIQQFCYPAGEPFHTGKPYVQQAIMSLLAQDGYVGATTDPPPVGMTQSTQKPFILLRVRVDGRESLPAFYASIPP